MKTKRYRIAKASNPKKIIGTITFRGRSRKEVDRNARAYAKRYRIPFSEAAKAKGKAKKLKKVKKSKKR